MHYILKHNLGCILADEMGLGKTWQIIALIVDLLNENKINSKPGILIIVPLNLISNWEKEFTVLAPDVSIHCYTRKKRYIPKCDVIIMSYSLVAADIEILHSYAWSLLILDEAHSIKGPSTARNRTIMSINATHKIAVTGTPFMNNAFDWWSIINFVNPGCVGTYNQFKYYFLMPWEYYGDDKPQNVIIQMIKTFIIRRYKIDVLKLPNKITTIHFVKLGVAQLAYDEIVYNKGSLCKEYKKTKKIKNKLNLLPRNPVQQDFGDITYVKQICNHLLQPYVTKHRKVELIDNDFPFNPELLTSDPLFNKRFSSKMLKTIEIIKIAILEGRKGLLFTQFVSGEIIEKLLLKEGFNVKFFRGRCSITERNQIINDFQNPESKIDVLILSLSTGGVGLNLTAATYVIHFDLWWNPAAINQATDRAHRQGQTKIVYVHILIVSDTWEQEHYDFIIKRKERQDEVFYTALKEAQQSMDKLQIPTIEEIYMIFKKYIIPKEKLYQKKKLKIKAEKLALKKELKLQTIMKEIENK